MPLLTKFWWAGPHSHFYPRAGRRAVFPPKDFNLPLSLHLVCSTEAVCGRALLPVLMKALVGGRENLCCAPYDPQRACSTELLNRFPDSTLWQPVCS